jgi:hypothetical protein
MGEAIVGVVLTIVVGILVAVYLARPRASVHPSRDPSLARSQDELLQIAEAYRAEASEYAAILQLAQSKDQAGLINLDEALQDKIAHALQKREQRERGLPKGDS